MTPEPVLITRKQAAAILGVTPDGVYKMVQRGDLRNVSPFRGIRTRAHMRLVEAELRALVKIQSSRTDLDRRLRAIRRLRGVGVPDDIRQARREAGLTDAQVAEAARTGLRRVVLAQSRERWREVSVATLERIAAAVGRKLVMGLGS